MKTTVTVVLLAFVAASVVFLAVGESRSKPADSTQPARQEGSPAPAGNHSTHSGADFPEAPTQATAVMAYYFHGTARCPTCLRMEKWAQEAVEQKFAAEIESGGVRWLAIDYDEPANARFVKQYSLLASAVVLAPQGEGRQGEWRNLTRIWDLAGDEAAFKYYVADELARLLRGG